MPGSISVEQKKRGRPATGQDRNIGVRLSDDQISKIDAWAAARGVTRSEAIRAMIEATLKLGGLD